MLTFELIVSVAKLQIRFSFPNRGGIAAENDLISGEVKVLCS